MSITEQEQQRYELMGAIAALAVIAYGADCIAVLEESLAEVIGPVETRWLSEADRREFFADLNRDAQGAQ